MSVFNENTVIEKVSFEGSSSIEIEASAFSGCTALKSVSLPSGLTVLPDYMFFNCTALEEVIMPEALEEIGVAAFDACTELAAIDLKNVKNIKKSAFWGSGLKEIIIPASVQTIGEKSFAYCEQLETVTFLGGVTIEKEAFNECKKLKEAILPDTLTYIGDSAFQYCDVLETVRVPESVTDSGYGMFTGSNNIKIVEVKEGSYADLEYSKFGVGVDRKTYY